jgi:hypothetical protein
VVAYDDSSPGVVAPSSATTLTLGQAQPFLNPFRSAALQPRRKESDLLVRTILSVVLGAGVGFGLHRFVGCRTGACPIWASPFASTAYGALLGFLLSR